MRGLRGLRGCWRASCCLLVLRIHACVAICSPSHLLHLGPGPTLPSASPSQHYRAGFQIIASHLAVALFIALARSHQSPTNCASELLVLASAGCRGVFVTKWRLRASEEAYESIQLTTATTTTSCPMTLGPSHHTTSNLNSTRSLSLSWTYIVSTFPVALVTKNVSLNPGPGQIGASTNDDSTKGRYRYLDFITSPWRTEAPPSAPATRPPMPSMARNGLATFASSSRDC